MAAEIICVECREKIGEKEGIEEGETHSTCLKCENRINENRRIAERIRDMVKHPSRKPAAQK